MTFSACTSARWTVKDEAAIDRTEYKILESREFLHLSKPLTAENPSLILQVQAQNTYEYSEKVLAQRTIQDYKLKPAFFALGMLGGGLAAYAANSGTFSVTQSSAASFSLNVAAVLMAGAGIMNMKPVGDPRPTGEERFLRTSGSIIEQDTTTVTSTEGQSAGVNVRYGNQQLLQENNRPISQGQLEIGLGGLLSRLEIKGTNTEQVHIEIAYGDSTYRYTYSLDQVLQPFARVTTPVTELRSSPEQTEGNILAELVEDSQLQIVDMVNSDWYKILYGISENYITRSDTELIWRTSDFSESNEVVAVPIVPFGNIDVENNIPILSGFNPNARGLIITNENYNRPFQARSHAHRDGRLMRAYMENALGFSDQNIQGLQDIQSADPIFDSFQELREQTNDSTQIIIYLSGYGSVQNNSGDYDLSYLPIGEQREGDSVAVSGINLQEVFREIATLPTENLLLVADIEFIEIANSQLNQERLEIAQPLDRIADFLIDSKPEAAIIFGSQIGQNSEVYVGDRAEDKKHHILPYFFARALQERQTQIGSIFEYLQRNIPYTARRLHDRSQDPQLFGNPSLQLIHSR